MANIGYIFVLGYFASATLGTYVAALGDQHGHRKLVMLHGVSYGIACVAMRWSSLAVLLVSRVLSGVAYSLLFSSFESWAITEVDRMRIDRRYLVQLFSAATFFNAASAVAAGIAGNAVGGESGRTDDVRDGGEQIRARVRRRRGLVVHVRAGREDVVGGGGSARAPAEAEAEKAEKSENRSARRRNEKARACFRAARMVLAEPALLSLGSMNSLYEAALHVFVFVWTPALERRCGRSALAGSGAGAGGPDPEVPHGLVFSLFMACKMAGSQLFALIGDRVPRRPHAAAGVHRLGGGVRGAAAGVAGRVRRGAVFVLRVRVWARALLAGDGGGARRARCVPNHLRATMTSVFRVPLNVLVMACLAFAGNADEPRFLMMCFSLMTLCLLFAGRRSRAAAEKTSLSAVAAEPYGARGAHHALSVSTFYYE